MGSGAGRAGQGFHALDPLGGCFAARSDIALGEPSTQIKPALPDQMGSLKLGSHTLWKGVFWRLITRAFALDDHHWKPPKRRLSHMEKVFCSFGGHGFDPHILRSYNLKIIYIPKDAFNTTFACLDPQTKETHPIILGCNNPCVKGIWRKQAHFADLMFCVLEKSFFTSLSCCRRSGGAVTRNAEGFSPS